MNASYLDLVFIVILLFCSIFACIKGFVKELFTKGAPILSLWMAILFYKQVMPLLAPYISNRLLLVLASFLAIFVVVFIVLQIVQMILGSIFKTPLLSQLDHALGFLLGLVEGLAIVVLIVIIINAQPWFDVTKFTTGSRIYEFISPIVSSQNLEFLNQKETAMVSALF